MSQENVEIVRFAYRERYERRTIENLREVVADDSCFHMRPGWPGRALYRFDEMPQAWADLDDTYTEYSLVPEHFAAVEDYVVVTLRQSARSADLDNEQDALEAVGLRQ